MTVKEFCELLGIPAPESPVGDYVIFINGLPSFDDAEVDHMAKVVYMKG